jgi:hypothetical protein
MQTLNQQSTTNYKLDSTSYESEKVINFNAKHDMSTTTQPFQTSVATTMTKQDTQPEPNQMKLPTRNASPKNQDTEQPNINIAQSSSVTVSKRSIPIEISAAQQEIKVSPQTSAWSRGQPHVALPVTSSRVVPIPRNIHGDAAWPPGRPPSSGPAESEARFQTDQGAATLAALKAWRTPAQPVLDQVVADAYAEMMTMINRPPTTQVLLTSTLPLSLNRLPPPHIPRSIDIGLLQDPEAEVRDLYGEPALPTVRTATRYYTNAEANKRGALTEQPRSRQVRGCTMDGMQEVRSSPAPSVSEPAVILIADRPDDHPPGLNTWEACSCGASPAGPALGGASSAGPALGSASPAGAALDGTSSASPALGGASSAGPARPARSLRSPALLGGASSAGPALGGASSAGPALAAAPGRSDKAGDDPADPRILQDSPPLAEPEGGGGG